MNQSEELKCKAIVIDRNGKAYYMQSMDEGLYHGEALLAYIKEKYPEAHEFDDLEVDSNRTIFAYRLGLYGDAVYYNVGSSGVIYLPNDVTDEQIDTIYNKVILDSIKYNIVKKDSIIIHYKHEMTNEIQESINDNDSNAVNRFKELVDGI